MIPTPGTPRSNQSVLIESGGERAFYLGDLVPNHAHLPCRGSWLRRRASHDPGDKASDSKAGRRREMAMIFGARRHVAWGRVEHDGKATG